MKQGNILALIDGQIISAEELARLAKEARISANETQSQAAERLSKTQPQISQAENGASRYLSTCMEMIAAYTDFEVVGKTFELRRKTD